MEQLQAFDGGTCGTSALTDVLGVAVPPAPTFPAVLDACCGGRMFWWNKANKDALFMDCREVEKGAFQNNWTPSWCVKPDEIADFRDMPFPDGAFKLVAFDPPHLKHAGARSWLRAKYGVLGQDWQDELRKGFAECFRVLADDGTLVFKWAEDQVKIKDVIALAPVAPLFGHPTGRKGLTHWLVFMKPRAAPANTAPMGLGACAKVGGWAEMS